MNDEINTELDSLEDDVEEFDLEAEGIIPPADDTPGEDDELEYDDEGNIVIPDDDAGDASGE